MGSAERKIAKENKIKALLKDIQSKDEAKILAGIKELKEHGNDSVILPIIDVWSKGVPSEIEKNIVAFLGDIKSKTSKAIIMQVLADKNYSPIHQPLLSTIWNSSVDYSAYIHEFVAMATESDFLLALECLTIVENLAGPFDEDKIMEAQMHLRKYAEQQSQAKTDEEKKLFILREIETILHSVKFQ